jgi:membrane fusion protein (multidrug efflux system)
MQPDTDNAMTSQTESRRKFLLPGIVALVVLLALPKMVSLFDTAQSGSTLRGMREQNVQVQTEILRAVRLGERVTTIGTILANEEVEIRSEIAGKIQRIFFREGGRVRKGDVLLKINDDELQARLLSARSKRELGDQLLERQRQLFEKNLISAQEYDAAVNEANVVRGEAQLIEAQLSKTEVRSPFDGMIGLRFVSEGSYISPATPITTLQDYGVVKIDFTFPEKYAASVRKGDKIAFTVQGSGGQFMGSIYAIAPKIDPATRTIRMRASSTNPGGELLPGAFANIQIQLREKTTLMAPAFALVPDLKGQKVFLLKSGRAEERRVHVGTRTDDRVEITDGLTEGDTLITSGILQLRPGMPVLTAASGQEGTR